MSIIVKIIRALTYFFFSTLGKYFDAFREIKNEKEKTNISVDEIRLLWHRRLEVTLPQYRML